MKKVLPKRYQTAQIILKDTAPSNDGAGLFMRCVGIQVIAFKFFI
tara:strand:- start:272 stop:406 length:135 start_codon:yes stop_codon:yes gene_type:complete